MARASRLRSLLTNAERLLPGRAAASDAGPSSSWAAPHWHTQQWQHKPLLAHPGRPGLCWLREPSVGLPALWGSQARLLATRAGPRPPQRQEAYMRLASSDPVRLVADDGSHRIITYGEAVAAARAAASDLLMVARSARPPVMRLGDRQKALFARRQAEKEQRRKQVAARRAGSLKEVRVSAAIAEADLERQLGLARGFLQKGHKVRLSVLHPRRPGARLAALQKLAAVRERVQQWAALEPEGRQGSGMPSLLLAPLEPSSEAA